MKLGCYLKNLPVTSSGEIRRPSVSELTELTLVAWKTQEKQRNGHSRNAALQIHLMAQKMIPYGTVLILTALT
jgi:hypothetical protein